MKLTVSEIFKEINNVTRSMIATSLCNAQNYPLTQAKQGKVLITVPNEGSSSIFKDISYEDMYNTLIKENNFNIKMLDGALITMIYTFDRNERTLLSHRLAFFPSPCLDPYEIDSTKFDQDELYAEVIDKRKIPVAFRFDYDKQAVANSSDHPASHFTLGQYQHCRIPVSAALTPTLFIHFIVENFYYPAYDRFSRKCPRGKLRFPEEIENDNKSKVYLKIPTSHL